MKNPVKTIYTKIAIRTFLVLATLIVYRQTGGFDFVNFDDDRYVTENRYIRGGLTREGVAWAFTDVYAGNWHPLTWISHMLDIEIFGMYPGMHHLTSVALHACNALLVFDVLRRMTGEIWKSAFVAALFALHPLHVESVAWIAQRKDVLSAFFGLLSLWAYAGYACNPGIVRYVLVFIFFALGLMSKPTLVTLPCVLLLLDYWPLQRFSPVARRVLEKAPLFLLAGFSCWITYTAQQYGGAVRSMQDFSLQARVGNALISYMAYIGKMLWPADLLVFYPHPGESLPIWQAAAAVLALSATAIIAFRNINRYPYLAVGWLWYLGTLVPVIGLVQVGHQALADRYTYLPLLGLFVIAAWGVPDLTARWPRRDAVLCAACAVLLSTLVFAAWKQAGYWKGSVALYEHVLSVSPANVLAKHNYAEAQIAAAGFLEQQGNFDEASERLQKALHAYPDYAKAHDSFGNLLSWQGKTPEAIVHYRQSVETEPDNAKFRNNLGVALLQTGATEQAGEQFRLILKLQPEAAEPHNNIGLMMLRKGLPGEAVLHFEAAIKSWPDEPGFHYNKALALSALGDASAAIHSLETALKLRPDFELAGKRLEKLRLSLEKRV